MSDTNKPGSQVILVREDDDDDHEDVEVVFTNLSKSHVYRNLFQQKISQEIELLQALSKKQTVPNEFNEFKDHVKKLGFHFGDDVIRSAWLRVMKKYLSKLSCCPSNKAPVCRVAPLVPSSITSSSEVNVISSTMTVSSPSVSVTPAVVPVALLLNTSFQTRDSAWQRRETFIRHLQPINTIEIDDDENCGTTNTDNSAEKTLDSAQARRCSEISVESANKNYSSTNKNNSRKRKSRTNDFSFNSNMQGLSITNTDISADKTLDPAQESGYSEISSESANKSDNSTNKKNSKKRKLRTNDFSFNSDKQGLSKNSSGGLDVVQNSVERSLCDRYFDSLASEPNQLSEEQVTQKSSKKYKNSNTQMALKSLPQVLHKTVKHSLSSTESNQAYFRRKINASVNKKCLEKRKSSSLDKQCLINNRPELSDDPQNVYESRVQSMLLEYHHSCGLSRPKDLKKNTQKSNSPCKKDLSEESLKTVDHSIANSHVGVRAKIVRTKHNTPPTARKRLSKSLKEMSKAELKEFMAEQKRLKREEEHQFELQQLQKVHDRLVDVLIPKYYLTNLNG